MRSWKYQPKARKRAMRLMRPVGMSSLLDLENYVELPEVKQPLTTKLDDWFPPQDLVPRQYKHKTVRGKGVVGKL